MIRPTLPVVVFASAGFNAYAEPQFAAPAPTKVAAVRLSFSAAHTTVRTDSSGSHGAAAEKTATVVLLFRPKDLIKLDDEIELLHNRVRVTEVHPRFTAVGGVHDHNEVHCVRA